MTSLLFERLSLLELVDQLQLFSGHSVHLLLVHLLLIGFPGQLFFELSLDLVLPIDHIHFLLLGSTHLLSFNHLLQLLSLRSLSFLLQLKAFPNLFFLELCLVSLAPSVVYGLYLLELCPLVLLLAALVVCLSLGLLLGFLLLPAGLLLLVGLQVAPSLGHDLICPLSSLFNFFDGLKY